MRDWNSVCGGCKNYDTCLARHLNENISQRPVTACDIKEIEDQTK